MAIVGGLVAVGVIWPNTADKVPTALEPGAPQVYHEPKPIKLTNTSRAKALATAANFVKTAVAREHVERSWLLASPGLKQGFTRKEWSLGEIPVVPYPVAQARWKLDYAYADALGLQVLLFPKAGLGDAPEPVPDGAQADGRCGAPALARRLLDAERRRQPGPAGARLDGGARRWRSGGGAVGVPSLDPQVVGNTQSRLGAAWLFLPLTLFAIVPIVLGIFAIRSWRRSRRAEREYREHAARRAGLSP